MSLNNNKLEDIKSLYESIHHGISEEVEMLNEVGGGIGAALQAQQAAQQKAQAQSARTQLQKGSNVALQGGTGHLNSAATKAQGRTVVGFDQTKVPVGPRGGTVGAAVPKTQTIGGQKLYQAKLGGKTVFVGAKPAQAPAGGQKPVQPLAANQKPVQPPAGAPRPAAPGAGAPAKVAPTAGQKPAGAPAGAPAKPMSAMDKWRAANPKLAAAADEKARIRGTSQTDNPLMKDMRSGLPMNSPSVQSPAVAKLGAGNQSLTQNPNAFKAATPAAGTPTSRPGGFGASANQMAANSSVRTGAAGGPIRPVTPTQATAAAPSTSAAASGSVVPATNRIAAMRQQPPVAPAGAAGAPNRAEPLWQQFDYDDAYDLVIEYLIDDGHADDMYEAAYIITEMEAETVADIILEMYGTESGRKKLAKKIRAGKDIGKKGKGFEKIVNKASKKYGKKRATKIAAAAMWKNLAK